MKVMSVQVSSYRQNCSFLSCEQTGAVVVLDPGADLEHVLRIIQTNHFRVEKIVLTHGHADHAACAYILSSMLGNIPLLGPHKSDDVWIREMPWQCHWMGLPVFEAFTPHWLEEGDRVYFGEESLDVYFCPGHTPGHICYVNKKARYAFTGDTLFKETIGITHLPYSNHADLIHSIKHKLLPLGDDIGFTPGHGHTSSFGHERLYNMHIK